MGVSGGGWWWRRLLVMDEPRACHQNNSRTRHIDCEDWLVKAERRPALRDGRYKNGVTGMRGRRCGGQHVWQPVRGEARRGEADLTFHRGKE
ncbi:hypothetical protein E2C01_035367 [Portunus trituberculatus]|uniref:Uncharacterized protein n=1 Tax=Portunus trituberculatus TaxID=210409 RepID=A0A5B7F859_PORTR|nr:hypothetical protein [Portunus trituberculatus]